VSSVFDFGFAAPPSPSPPVAASTGGSVFDFGGRAKKEPTPTAKPASVFDFAKAAPKRALDAANDVVRGGGFNALDASRNVAGGVLDVLGAPQRAVAGGISGAMHGGVVEAINRAGYNTFHPHDEAKVAAADKDVRTLTHLEDLKDHSANPNWLGKARNFAVDLGGQTITDPMMLVGFGEAEKAIQVAGGLARKLPGAELAIKGAKAIGESKPVQELNDLVRVRGKEKRSLERAGITQLNFADTTAHNHSQRFLKQAQETVDAHAPAIKAHDAGLRDLEAWKIDTRAQAKEAKAAGEGFDPGEAPKVPEFPAPVRTELLRAAYVLGTHEVRSLAVKAGFRPSELESAQPALNKMEGFLDEYRPKQTLYDQKPLPGVERMETNAADTAAPFGVVRKYRAQKAGYTFEQKAGDESAPLVDRIKGRFDDYARDIETNLRHKRTASGLGLNIGRDELLIQRATGKLETATDPAVKAEMQTVIDAARARVAEKNATNAKTVKPYGQDVANSSEFKLGEGDTTPDMTMREARSKAIGDLGLRGKELKWRSANEGPVGKPTYVDADPASFKSEEALRSEWRERVDALQIQRERDGLGRLTDEQLAKAENNAVGYAQRAQEQPRKIMPPAAPLESVAQTGTGAAIRPMDRKTPATAMAGNETAVQMLDGHVKSLVAARGALDRIRNVAAERGAKIGDVTEATTQKVGETGLEATAAADPTRAMAGIRSAIDGDAAQALASKEWLGSSRASGPKFDEALINAAMRRLTPESIAKIGPGRGMAMDDIHAAIGEARSEYERRVAIVRDPKKAEQGLRDDLKAWRGERAAERQRLSESEANPVAGRVDKAITGAEKALGKNQEAVFGAAREGQSAVASGGRKIMRNVAGITRKVDDAERVAANTVERVTARQQAANARNQVNIMRNAAIGQRDELALKYYNTANTIVTPNAIKSAVLENQGKLGQISFLKGFSDFGKAVMFFNPLPHMKNITVLQIEGPGGEKVAVEGARLAATLKPEEYADIERTLEDAGGLSTFFQQRKDIWQQGVEKMAPRLGKLTAVAKDWSNDKLWKFDIAQRWALYKHLKADAKYKDLPEAEIGAIINDTLFDYAHKSPLAESLESVGAPFPHWRLTNITRQAKAFVQNPAAIDRMARVENVANNDFGMTNKDDKGRPAPFRIGMNAPYEEFAKAVNPATTMSYAATTGGPVSKAMYDAGTGNIQDRLGMNPIGGAFAEAARMALPGEGLISDALGGGKFPSNAEGLSKAMFALLGAYPRNERSIITDLVARFKKDGNGTGVPMNQIDAERSALKYHRQYYQGQKYYARPTP
jgi:hypothetical protein